MHLFLYVCILDVLKTVSTVDILLAIITTPLKEPIEPQFKGMYGDLEGGITL